MRVNVPWVDPNKPMPPWLAKRKDRIDLTPRQRHTVNYYIKIYRRTPKWETRKNLEKVYLKAKEMRARGIDVEVDHVIPLNGVNICGLHCVANLRIVSRKLNQSKSNHYYPGMANEQMDFFNSQESVEQYEFAL